MAKTTQTFRLRRLWWIGPLTVAASVLGVLFVRILAVAILKPDPEPMALGWIAPIFFTVILVTGAVFVFAAVARFAKNPIRTWQIIAFIALLLSFLPDVAWAQSGMPGTNWPNALALMIMHVVAWALCVTLLPKLSADRT